MKLNISKITIPVLSAAIGVVIGLMVSDCANWVKYITPLAILISATIATAMAIQSINNARHLEKIKRTLEKLNELPELGTDYYWSIIKKIKTELNKCEELKQEPKQTEIKKIVESLDEKERSFLGTTSNFFNDLARGIKHEIFDEELIVDTLGSAPLLFWNEAEIFIKYHMSQTDEINLKLGVTLPIVFKNYEIWVEKLKKYEA